MVTDIVIKGVGDSEWVLHRVDRWRVTLRTRSVGRDERVVKQEVELESKLRIKPEGYGRHVGTWAEK